MMHIHELNLKDLQPSQFYISEKKLRDIEAWLNPAELSCFEPIPIKLLDGRPVMTDGHTRAVAALRAGLEAVPLVWDADIRSIFLFRTVLGKCSPWISWQAAKHRPGKWKSVFGKTRNPFISASPECSPERAKKTAD